MANNFLIAMNWDYWIPKLTITAFLTAMVATFYSIWIVKLTQHLIQSIKLRKTNENKDFRDTREQDKILYNLETHIVKDVILLFLCFAEVCEILLLLANGITSEIMQRKSSKPEISENPLHCSLSMFYESMISTNIINSPFVLLWSDIDYTLISASSILFLLLLSFMTEYLSRRYYSQPYLKLCMKYLIIFFVQFTIMLILVNRQIHVFQYIISPIFAMVDWCILVRNSKCLLHTLDSHLNDLNLLTNRFLYTKQRHLIKIYAFSMPILLTALFFGAFTLMFHNYTYIAILISTCNQSYNKLSQIFSTMKRFGTLGLMSIHVFLLGLPLYIISIQMCLSACLKRFCMKPPKTRFSYSNFPRRV